MSEILIRREGRAGRITLNRPEALNALSYPMCLALDAALIGWRDDPDVALVLIDAAGDRAFCAGGDIAQLYAEGIAGNHDHGRDFWRDEYRMNARIADYAKPVVSLIHGFCMGGGVGVACHASHRIVGETAQIAMPECAIGLVPDVGGSALLAHAPGHLGAYLGTTGRRMGPADAIYAGFADYFVPQSAWPDLIATLCTTGDVATIPGQTPPPASLPALQAQIDLHFASADLARVLASLDGDDSDFARETRITLSRVSPLAAALTLAIQAQLGPTPSLRQALELEYRVSFRAQADTDFLEGIRAMIIDKDRKPRWQAAADAVAIAALLAPLGPDTLTFTEE